jgi:predicted nucleic acid-binding protein
VRGKDTGQAIEKACDLWSRPSRPLVAIVSHGEVRAFALHRRWEEAKMKQIRGILGYTIPVDIRNDAVNDQYARLHSELVTTGYTLSDNDLWIAAVSIVADATLVTNDNDFGPLQEAGRLKLLHIPTTRSSS